jgi:hypothetical protein
VSIKDIGIYRLAWGLGITPLAAPNAAERKVRQDQKGAEAMKEYGGHETVREGGIMLRTKVNYWAVLVAAATTLVTSALYYLVFGDAWLTLRGLDPNTADVTPQPGQMVGQLGHNLVIALALAYVLARLEVRTRKDALRVGLLVWVGFQAMAVAGSVLHENYPLGLYLIHVGDALQATLLMALVLTAWRRDVRRDVEISPSASTSS